MRWMLAVVSLVGCSESDIGFERAPYLGEDGAPSIESATVDCGCCPDSRVAIQVVVSSATAEVQAYVFGTLNASGEPVAYTLQAPQSGGGAHVVRAGTEQAEPPAMLLERCDDMRSQQDPMIETWPVRIVVADDSGETDALLAADFGVFSGQ